MYLQIGENRHSVRRRIVYEDAVVYLSVTPKPVEVAGMIQLCRDDGFVLAEDDAAFEAQRDELIAGLDAYRVDEMYQFYYDNAMQNDE